MTESAKDSAVQFGAAPRERCLQKGMDLSAMAHDGEILPSIRSREQLAHGVHVGPSRASMGNSAFGKEQHLLTPSIASHMCLSSPPQWYSMLVQIAPALLSPCCLERCCAIRPGGSSHPLARQRVEKATP